MEIDETSLTIREDYPKRFEDLLFEAADYVEEAENLPNLNLAVCLLQSNFLTNLNEFKTISQLTVP